jgi:hypothetical protein
VSKKQLRAAYILVVAVAFAALAALIVEAAYFPNSAYWHVGPFLGSVLVALGWMVTSENTIKNSQKQQTTNLTLHYDSNAISQGHRKTINQYIPQPEKLIPNGAKIPPYTDSNHELYVAVDYELNTYEFIALGVRREVLDADMIRESFESKFKAFYSQTAAYIGHTQEQYGSDTWNQFVWLCNEWNDASPVSGLPKVWNPMALMLLAVGLLAGFLLTRLFHH